MLEIGDIVKVIGKTLDGCGEEKELIPIGTICRIIDIDDNHMEGLIVEIVPENKYLHVDYGYWYSANDVEKGHFECIKS